MTFEKALEEMKQGKKAKPKTDKFAYEIHNGKSCLQMNMQVLLM